MFLKKSFFLVIFFILNSCSKMIIVFVHPSTIFSISGELVFPAIQNIKLPGFWRISEKTLYSSCYEVFNLFLKNYIALFGNKETEFFMFNWSGIIYPITHKTEESVNLFYSLYNLKNQYKDDKIILIGCSHGGNVILEMSGLLKKYNMEIDLVVLLGTPISIVTQVNANQKLSYNQYVFSKILNIYSESDYIQKLDVFFNNFHFCDRVLLNRSGVINYQIYNYGHIDLWHKVFFKDPFVIYVPFLLDMIEIIK